MTQETVLVVGGCGFVGYHIIRHMEEQHPEWPVHVMSRNPTQNLIDGVQYHAGSLSLYEDVQGILEKVSLTVIIHSASPVSMSGHTLSGSAYFQANVEGTRCLLDCAIAAQTVKAFVFTSSMVVLEGDAHDMTIEDAPIKTRSSKTDNYSISKAIADQLVLDANSKSLMSTVCLRVSSIYGEKVPQCIAGSVAGAHRGEHKFQIGDNTNLFDPVSVMNTARAHILAVDALLRERADPSTPTDRSVAGQAFHVTDGRPVPFWTFFRLIWKAAGEDTTPSLVLPPWLMMGLATVVEMLYWVFTLGTRQPQTFRRDKMKYTFMPWTFSIEKARTRLGYDPVDDRQEQVEAGVNWYLARRRKAQSQDVGKGEQ